MKAEKHSNTRTHERVDSTAAHDVTVVGCGLMGAEIARSLAGRGLSVAVWNRTHERAAALAAPGIAAYASVQNAVHAAPLTIVCTTTYEAALEALAPVDAWAGRTIAMLTSGTPQEAEHMAAWAAGRAAAYLDGALFCYPHELGDAATVVTYSGSADAWSRHGATLTLLGGASHHLSEQVATANLLLVGFGGWLVASLSAYLEAIDYLSSHSVPVSAALQATARTIELLRYATAEAAEAIDAGDFSTDQATISTFAQGVRDGLSAVRASGRPGLHLSLASDLLDAAEDAGLGGLGFGAAMQVLPQGHRPSTR